MAVGVDGLCEVQRMSTLPSWPAGKQLLCRNLGLNQAVPTEFSGNELWP